MFGRQMIHGSTVSANPETIEGMLESLGKFGLAPSGLVSFLPNYSFCSHVLCGKVNSSDALQEKYFSNYLTDFTLILY